MRWTAWAVAILVLVVGGWMAFDGVHALWTGDYVTPESGRFAGELGPWAAVVEAVGLEPRSTAVEGAFVLYGLAYLGATGAFLARRTRSLWWTVQVLALAGLWYLPFGTLGNVLVIGLLWSPALRRARMGDASKATG